MKKSLFISLVAHIIFIYLPFTKEVEEPRIISEIYKINLIKFNKESITNSEPSINSNQKNKIESSTPIEDSKKIFDKKDDNSNDKVEDIEYIKDFSQVKEIIEKESPLETKEDLEEEKLYITSDPSTLDATEDYKLHNNKNNYTTSEHYNENHIPIIEKKLEEDIYIKDNAIDNYILGTTNGINLIIDNSNLEYKILRGNEAVFPREARRLNLNSPILIGATFIIDLDGRAKEINIFSDYLDFKRFGFAREVEKAIKSYEFTPIFFEANQVEVLFYKEFIFEQN